MIRRPPTPFDSPARIEAVHPKATTGEEDVDLLAGLRSLKPESYEALLDRFEAPLYRFFYYSHGSHDLAEDQCGDTFACVITAVHKMHGDAGALRSFIFGIARNVLKRGWRARKTVPLEGALLDLAPDRQPAVWRQAADRQEWDLALGAIECLGDPARQIILLRFVEGLSLDEVAAAMHLPLGSIKSTIHRSRKRLKALLDETA